MKHAGPEALDELDPLLDELRSIGGLVEKKPGLLSQVQGVPALPRGPHPAFTPTFEWAQTSSDAASRPPTNEPPSWR